MGITIHYQGKINNTYLIDEFTSEIKDISDELNWKYDLIDDDELNIKGILISPLQDCESLSFLFDKTNGILKDRIILVCNDLGDEHYKYNHTKTQFAPITIHITIIKLLKYLKDKYLSDLIVTDEGDYWETEDAELLLSKFNFLNNMINILTDELGKTEKIPGEPIELLADRIEKVLTEILQKNNNKHG